MSLGINIKKARKKKEFTQQQLAEELGLTIYAIRKYENGERTPNIETLEKISKTLDIQFHELLNYESSPYVQDFVKYRINDLVEETAFETFKFFYDEMNIKDSTKLSALDFYNKDKYLSESLVDAIANITKSNIEVYKKRIEIGENSPRKGSLFIKYPFGEASDIEGQYRLGNKDKDKNYLLYTLKDNFIKLISLELENNDIEFETMDKKMDEILKDLKLEFYNQYNKYAIKLDEK